MVNKPYRDKLGRFAKKPKRKKKKRVIKKVPKKRVIKKVPKKRVKRKKKIFVPSKAYEQKELLKRKIPKKTTQFFEKLFDKIEKTIPVFEIETGEPKMYSEDIEDAPEVYMHSSHSMLKSPSSITKEGETIIVSAFEEAFTNMLKRGPFEADEIFIYRHGIIVRPNQGTLTNDMKEKIVDILKDIPNSSMHIVKEDNTFSLRINIGSAVKGELAGKISNSFEKNKEILNEIFEELREVFDDIDWFVFWDTEEVMYE